ncbi:MAG: zinc-ribbon domain-containing protein [Pelagibacteraceae bacterium]|jgi:predicted Zn finger-like uncharacterized protein|nr:zinc-ribbon domain-containing protein [Pelagibacteraceae bacterium]MDP6784317.1 zinc-ribbon domain-containing protein [Alphaproteobacteria bacterium]MBO6466655.1 zinc-ribbon domain-containing protein [Pelagibacteraceae bacterium]MBO6468028.1 zinc-ribbon domain-containing protein [Pelagibacteraceae bacterium]MBO6471702.1 zinc-ribbon domain-containing protein [Pelagibacteraceae bacterium]|tara:strand:- start:308 stop:727 length:420 start_codon:yes stop_codon:yes gene_type:complete
MLVSCSSCNSKYLVNSADLKPDGRIVQCAKCGHNWFQTTKIEDEEILSTSIPSFEKKIDKNNNNLTTNLPSTFVKEKKHSILNSILAIIALVAIIIVFWFLKNNGLNIFVLINFFLQEFYFNLNMIIDDLTKTIHHLLN